jgi:hypothetical protein
VRKTKSQGERNKRRIRRTRKKIHKGSTTKNVDGPKKASTRVRAREDKSRVLAAKNNRNEGNKNKKHQRGVCV